MLTPQGGGGLRDKEAAELLVRPMYRDFVAQMASEPQRCIFNNNVKGIIRQKAGPLSKIPQNKSGPIVPARRRRKAQRLV